MAGIVDEPIMPQKTGELGKAKSLDDVRAMISASDTLGLSDYAFALAQFASRTNTPITIGIQGAWGSGKTSLLNLMNHFLNIEGDKKQIWVNAWENALMSSPEETLMKITHEIIEELVNADYDVGRKEKIISSSKTVFRGALRIGASAAFGLKAGDVVDEIFQNVENGSPIKNLRCHLEELTTEIHDRKTNAYEKIIIYIDDLDRIEPKDAVRLLELLKNIFSLPHCVFVLAIDYEVIVKGLSEKFGARTPENDREFRAYFDKIIQLPFMMPVGSYSIGNYVGGLLENVGFVQEGSYNPANYDAIIRLSVRGNPRSIKRLINSLSLISVFVEAREHHNQANENLPSEIRKTLLFAVVCIQIAYPEVYELLLQEPDFERGWNEEWAQNHAPSLNADERFRVDFEAITDTDEFDDEWEQSLYRVTYRNPEYHGRIHDVSRLLNFIKDDLLNGVESPWISFASVIGETSVTSVSLNDRSMHRSTSELRGLQQKFFEALRQKLIAEGHEDLVGGRTPGNRNWFDLSVGISHTHISLNMSTKKKVLRAAFIWSAREQNSLIMLKKGLMSEAAPSFTWDIKDGRNGNYFVAVRENFDINNTAEWEENIDWLYKRILEIVEKVVPLLKNPS